MMEETAIIKMLPNASRRAGPRYHKSGAGGVNLSSRRLAMTSASSIITTHTCQTLSNDLYSESMIPIVTSR